MAEIKHLKGMLENISNDRFSARKLRNDRGNDIFHISKRDENKKLRRDGKQFGLSDSQIGKWAGDRRTSNRDSKLKQADRLDSRANRDEYKMRKRDA